MKKNIFVLGNLTSAYRVDNYIRAFLELGYRNIYINTYNRSKLVRLFVNIIVLLKSDIVFVPPLQHNNRLLKLAVFLKKEIIVDFYISYYDSNVFDYKKFDYNSKMASHLKKQDIFIIKNSSLVLFLNSSEREFYLKSLGITSFSDRQCILPLVVPEKKGFAKLNYINEKDTIFKICWVGTYIPLHGLENVIKAVKILVDNSYKVHLYLWGDSDDKARSYIDLTSSLNLDNNITFINNKWGDLNEWENFIIENCDLTLGVFGNSEKAKIVLPNKVIDGITFKTPVLTQFSKGVSEFFHNKEDVFMCDNDEKAISDKIVEVMKTPKNKIIDMTNSSYEKYKKDFDYLAFKNKVKVIFDRNIMR